MLPKLFIIFSIVVFSVRYGFIVLAIILAASIPILFAVDVKKGKKAARTFALNN
jgi:hypothetical protein